MVILFKNRHLRGAVLIEVNFAGELSSTYYITIMANKKFGPQYLTADGRFTSERPDWMPEKGIQTPKKEYPQKQLSDNAAKKVANILHIMLNNK